MESETFCYIQAQNAQVCIGIFKNAWTVIFLILLKIQGCLSGKIALI